MRSGCILIGISVVTDGREIENHTRNGDAMPFSRCEWAMAERDSRTPATRDESSIMHQYYRILNRARNLEPPAWYPNPIVRLPSSSVNSS